MRDLLRKTSNATLQLGSDDPLEFCMSDATPDRHGDTIDPTGWDLKEFAGNPIALMNHNQDFVIGNWSNVRVVNGQLRGHLEMAPPGTSPRIDEFRRLVLGGIYRATSVGFRPIKYRERPNGGTHYERQTLLECSIVSIPSNPAALRIEAKALGVSESTIKQLIDRPPVNATLAQRQDFARRRLAAARAKMATTLREVDATNRRIAAHRAKQSAAESAKHRASMAKIDAETKLDLELVNAKSDLDFLWTLDRQEKEKQAKRNAVISRKRDQRDDRIGAVMRMLNERGFAQVSQEIMKHRIAGNTSEVDALVNEAVSFLNGGR